MTEHKIGVIMNGVTGRMGTNQHLMRSIVEIIKEGGVKISPGETIIPDPVLIGRDENKLKKLCLMSGIKKMSTDLDQVIYFEAQITGRRDEGIRKAVKARKHIYCEKPIATDPKQAMELYRL